MHLHGIPTVSHGTAVSLKKNRQKTKIPNVLCYTKILQQGWNSAQSQAGFLSLLQVSGASGEELDTKEMNHILNANLYMGPNPIITC